MGIFSSIKYEYDPKVKSLNTEFEEHLQILFIAILDNVCNRGISLKDDAYNFNISL